MHVLILLLNLIQKDLCLEITKLSLSILQKISKAQPKIFI